MSAAVSIPSLPEPLRLPRGSVRGFLALAIAATLGYLLIQGVPVASVIVNSVIVVIAFYYGGGGRATPVSSAAAGSPPAVDRRRRVVQALLLGGFAGLTGWLLRSNPSLSAIPPELQAIWQVLGGYLAGAGLAWLIHRRAHETRWRRMLAIAFRDISAAAAILLTAAICVGFATGQQGLFLGRAEEALSLVITYYFGSRVIR